MSWHTRKLVESIDFTGMPMTLPAMQTGAIIKTKLRPLWDKKTAKIIDVTEDFN
ncbi:conserved hypothetical protein [Xenorhabdus nematophila F1]|uniref:Uncharacterized protein n=1 Tax=Xenorhabdus nematophila (strain ATCC 19061 / DSM 3370 / CCUG 14189 / LMG 1036 / NCIMB 9965 / AN6) TaxID=406817 RepID=D3VIG6_XENNA|nr:conserved hypothetical protein [Xenorhabdus nematophila ATCC 19061]CCW29302.1 conserved hypothetical protein [Xenorhabdus nematophila F1]CEE90237.1 conserved hypothetical protein [Xenorhabdus nematophila str. Anatoliense]CEF32165.1 conserved hypothetical protein [Xenorhabdus nematophila str. Websteri]CEK23643.1 conserved hypothetical protein [Xenorhabdus nematophila AN6/1]